MMVRFAMAALAFTVLFIANAFSVYAAGTKQVAYAYPVLRYPFYLYKDAGNKINNFVMAGWTGDFRSLKIDTSSVEDRTVDNTCIRVRFIPVMQRQAAYGKIAPDMTVGHGYAGFAIQSNPENYWGSLRGGYDLTKAKKLFLFARGKNGGEKIEIGMRKKNSDEMTATAGMIELTKQWKVYEINLNNLSFTDSAGGLFVLLHSRDKVMSTEVYLDEIYFTQDKMPSVTMENGSELKERI